MAGFVGLPSLLLPAFCGPLSFQNAQLLRHKTRRSTEGYLDPFYFLLGERVACTGSHEF